MKRALRSDLLQRQETVTKSHVVHDYYNCFCRWMKVDVKSLSVVLLPSSCVENGRKYRYLRSVNPVREMEMIRVLSSVKPAGTT